MPLKEREITLRFLTQPTDVNLMGKVFGGEVMKWIDFAGYACAAGWCGMPCVTVYVGGIRFYKPINVGDLVEVHAKLIYTGTTSMHIAINVQAGDPMTRQFTQTTQCVIVFVALDEKGKPAAVPKWTPADPEDVKLEQYAKKLMELRQGIEEDMKPYLVGDRSE